MSKITPSPWETSRRTAERWLARWRQGSASGGDVATFCVGERCAWVRLGQGSGGRLRLLAAEVGGQGDLNRWGQSPQASLARATLVLQPAERHALVLDRPDVPAQELAQALRFSAAESLEVEPETLLTSVVEMPRINDNQRLQALTIAAPLAAVRAQLDQLGRAGLTVRSVDVIDSALRGMALLSDLGSAGSIMVAVYEGSASVGLIWNQQFCALRSFPLPATAQGQEQVLEDQLALQVQRTADQFERQASNLSVQHLMAALPLMQPARRQAVCDGLPFTSRLFSLSQALEGDADLLQRCDNDALLTQLVCVAAARLLDSRPNAAPSPTPAPAEATP